MCFHKKFFFASVTFKFFTSHILKILKKNFIKLHKSQNFSQKSSFYGKNLIILLFTVHHFKENFKFYDGFIILREKK